MDRYFFKTIAMPFGEGKDKHVRPNFGEKKIMHTYNEQFER